MFKYGKEVIVIVLMFCLCLCCTSAEAKKNNKKEIHIQYEKKINSINKKWKKICLEYGDTGKNYFSYYDINGDGVDECIIQHTSIGNHKNDNSILSNGGTDFAIYTYYKGKIKQIVYSFTGGGTWGGVYVSKNSKYIDWVNRDGSEHIYHMFYKICNGKLTKTGKSCSYECDFITGNKTYKVNGKVSNEKKYTLST